MRQLPFVIGIYSRKLSIMKEMSKKGYLNSTAITTSTGTVFTYSQILTASLHLSKSILLKHQNPKCIASFNSSGFNYIITALAAWRLGASFLPLCTTHPKSEIDYFLSDRLQFNIEIISIL